MGISFARAVFAAPVGKSLLAVVREIVVSTLLTREHRMAWRDRVTHITRPSFVRLINIDKHAIDAFNIAAETLVIEPTIFAVFALAHAESFLVGLRGLHQSHGRVQRHVPSPASYVSHCQSHAQP